MPEKLKRISNILEFSGKNGELSYLLKKMLYQLGICFDSVFVVRIT